MSIGVEDTFVRNFAVFLQERVLCFEKSESLFCDSFLFNIRKSAFYIFFFVNYVLIKLYFLSLQSDA